MSVGLLEQTLGQRAGRVKQLIVQQSRDGQWDEVVLMLNRVSAKDTADVMVALAAIEGISGLEEPAN